MGEACGSDPGACDVDAAGTKFTRAGRCLGVTAINVGKGKPTETRRRTDVAECAFLKQTVTIWAKGNMQQWVDAGVPVEIVVPRKGLIALPLFFQMLAGSTPEQQDVALQLINALLEPAALAHWCKLNGVAPTSSKVQLPARMASDPAWSKDAVVNAIQLDWPTLGGKDAEYRQKMGLHR